MKKHQVVAFALALCTASLSPFAAYAEELTEREAAQQQPDWDAISRPEAPLRGWHIIGSKHGRAEDRSSMTLSESLRFNDTATSRAPG